MATCYNIRFKSKIPYIWNFSWQYISHVTIDKSNKVKKKDKLEEYFVSTDKKLLDTGTIYEFLAGQSYWAKGRSLDVVMASIENSLCFGLYANRSGGPAQLGFARVVTDYSVFAWILDLFVLEEYRGLGLGKKLLGAIMAHPGLRDLQRWGLATQDAHGLYKQFGFAGLKHPGWFMEISNK